MFVGRLSIEPRRVGRAIQFSGKSLRSLRLSVFENARGFRRPKDARVRKGFHLASLSTLEPKFVDALGSSSTPEGSKELKFGHFAKS
jgi:hypothetical protein